MAAYQKGSDMLLKVDSDGIGTYQTVAAIQTKDIQLDQQAVDVTNQDSASKWKELLAGAGIKSVKIAGRGVFNNDASQQTITNYLINGTIRNWKVVVPLLGTFTGLMLVMQVKFVGEHHKEIQYDISLESGGVITLA